MAYLTPDTVEVVIVGALSSGRPCVNVFHLVKVLDDSPTVARDLLNNWQDSIVDNLCDDYVLQTARWRDDADATGELAPDPAKPVQGNNAGAAAAPNTSLLVKKLIDGEVGTRPGRMYLAPISEAAVMEDGTISGSDLTAWQGVVDGFLSGIDEDPLLVVLHRDAAGEATGNSTVTALQVDTRAATQRRRLRK